MNPVAIFVLGVLAGYALGAFAYERSFRLAARYQRTGGTEAPRGNVSERTVATSDGMAMRHISEDMVQNGADHILRAAEAEGVTITRKQAEDDARAMLLTHDPLGGVR